MSPSSGHPRENRDYGGGASSAPPPTSTPSTHPLPPSFSGPVFLTLFPCFPPYLTRIPLSSLLPLLSSPGRPTDSPSFGPGHEGSALIQWKGIGKLGNTISLLLVVNTSGKLLEGGNDLKYFLELYTGIRKENRLGWCIQVMPALGC